MRTSPLFAAALLLAASASAQTDAPASSPAASAVQVAGAEPAAAGAIRDKDTLSVDFPDEDIKTILRNVADLFELNLVIPDTLVGKTSIKLRDVTWRQIFQVVLAPVGYAFKEEGNIVTVIAWSALEAEPFATERVVLENVPAVSIESVLRPMLTPGVDKTKDRDREIPAKTGGSMVINSLANELLITDQPTVIRRMVETAKSLDVEPRQVVIETKFVEVTRSNLDSLGVSIRAQSHAGGGSNRALVDLNTLGQAFPGIIAGGGSNNIVLNAPDFAVVMNALATLQGTRVVSNPTIVAVNGSKSEITVGRDLQTITTTQAITQAGTPGQTTFAPGERIFEGVRVEITPQISSNKLVTIQVKAEKREAQPFSISAGGGASPQTFYDVRKREGSLNMILRDGQTAAIGGLIDQREQTSNSRVPILGDIPGLGSLFRSKRKEIENTNLLIFITANILEPSRTSYKSLSTPQQLNDLNLTERDIRGVSYPVSDEERAHFEAIQDKRKLEQDSRIRNQSADSPKRP